jgi:hypothetical protein
MKITATLTPTAYGAAVFPCMWLLWIYNKRTPRLLQYKKSKARDNEIQCNLSKANMNKAETCSMWTNSILPDRRTHITVLYILYNVESAQRGNGKQYLKNLLKITCIKRKVI